MQFPQFLTASTLVALGSLFITPTSYGQAHTKGRPVAPLTPTLKPGDYVWHPEVSPGGPVVILVSLPNQVLYVYRNGLRIGRSTVSTGKPGKRTPTGVFTVLQKKVRHEIEYLQRCADAAYATADLDRCGDARGQFARLSGIGGLCSDASGFRGQALLSHNPWSDGDYRG